MEICTFCYSFFIGVVLISFLLKDSRVHWTAVPLGLVGALLTLLVGVLVDSMIPRVELVLDFMGDILFGFMGVLENFLGVDMFDRGRIC